ncbi:Aste57867_20717 [Aphanomyces stellatus]|uniref:Aste57867_20717 protein n=1 Tax=Aphanomyces stellatus TaxID=120398 RepID=A0A485LGW6_9STRA|nr:hypothetical protein As57867_020649 [Aphanomyces stellatus]VFT97397.1 Aste57867_20717 [Aphanomyces stellatus]
MSTTQTNANETYLQVETPRGNPPLDLQPTTTSRPLAPLAKLFQFADKTDAWLMAIDESDKKAIDDKVTETINWLDANQSAEKEEYEAKQKELEGIANPIMQKLYASAGGAPGGMPGGMPDMGGAGAPPPASHAQGPKIEEVD